MFLILTVLWPLFFDVGLLSTTGMQQWNCPESYQLGQVQPACNAPAPFLIFSHGNDIFSIDIDGTNLRKVVTGAGSSVLLDFDHQEEKLYWVNQNRGVLQRIYLNGTKRERMRLVEKGALRFTVDWKHKIIFWANQQKGTIEWTGMKAKKPRILLGGLFRPIFIAVDPEERFLFWSSESAFSVIQKANLDGNNVTTVIETRGEIKSLTLDVTDKRVYWILYKSENGDASVGSCTYNGESATVVKNLAPSSRQRVWGLSLFSDHIYYSEGNSGSIRRANKYTGKDVVTITLKPSILQIADIKVVHPLKPHNAANYSLSSGPEACTLAEKHCTSICKMDEERQPCRCLDGFALSVDGKYCEDINECALWNHGCTLGCENIPGSYYCSCPKGFVLLPDNKTCHDETPCSEDYKVCSHGCVQTAGGPVCTCPEASVLARDGKTCTGCTSPDNGGCSQICVSLGPASWECDCFPGYILQLDKNRCLASGPRPFLLFANVHDIRRINFDGTEYESLLDSHMGRVFALDHDPVENRIYFAHTALKWIESANIDGTGREKVISEALHMPEGLTIDAINRKLYWTDRGKASIERSDLNGKNREKIIQENIHQPRGICVHPSAKRLFWTDMGANPKIESSSLKGSERLVVASTDLVWPSGITVDFLTDKLYWCDAKRSVIESSNLDGSNRQTLSQNEVGHPFDIAVFEDHIWLSDWVQPSIVRMDKRNRQHWIRLRGSMQRPSSLVIVHPLAKPAVSDGISQARNEKYTSNETAKSEAVSHGPLSRNIDETGKREETHNRNALVAEIMVSDESGCIDIHCDVNAQCVPSEHGARCQCLEGFAGNGKSCNDIDECSLHVDACNPRQAECINAEGGYICKCREGYSGNGLRCFDIDECRLGSHGCGETVICTNTEGNYTCTCTNGLPGTAVSCADFASTASTSTTSITNSSGRETVRECPLSHDGYCFNGGVCIHLPDLQEYGCSCVQGYMGERCQYDDLVWWEPHLKKMKIRNVTVAVSLIVLLLLLGLGSYAMYYYRHRMFHKQSPFRAAATADNETRNRISRAGEAEPSSEPGCLLRL
ncbi:hypothetical protein FKM82_001410 [Ascaphus truei]